MIFDKFNKTFYWFSWWCLLSKISLNSAKLLISQVISLKFGARVMPLTPPSVFRILPSAWSRSRAVNVIWFFCMFKCPSYINAHTSGSLSSNCFISARYTGRIWRYLILIIHMMSRVKSFTDTGISHGFARGTNELEKFVHNAHTYFCLVELITVFYFFLKLLKCSNCVRFHELFIILPIVWSYRTLYNLPWSIDASLNDFQNTISWLETKNVQVHQTVLMCL